MSDRETDLDRITSLLGRCLGRIDEQAFRLQRQDDDETDFDAPDVLEQEAATLQELVASVLQCADAADGADLNRIVTQAARECVAELGVPIVVHERLASDLPPVACGPGQLAYAVQRAVVIGLGRLAAGDHIVLATRREADAVVFELEAQGRRRDRHLAERTATLAEFVAELRGDCRVSTDDRGGLLIALELPANVVRDGA